MKKSRCSTTTAEGKKSYKLVSDQAKKAKILDYGEIHNFFLLVVWFTIDKKNVWVCLYKYAYKKIKWDHNVSIFQYFLRVKICAMFKCYRYTINQTIANDLFSILEINPINSFSFLFTHISTRSIFFLLFVPCPRIDTTVVLRTTFLSFQENQAPSG